MSRCTSMHPPWLIIQLLIASLKGITQARDGSIQN